MSSMTIGELVGYVDLDVDELSKGAKQGEKDIGEMTAAVLAAAEVVEKQKFTAKLDADARQLEEKIFDAEELLRYIDQYHSTPKVDADIAAAESKLREVTSELERLRTMDASVEVDADIAAAEADLRRVQDQLDRLNFQRATVDVDAETDRARYDLIQMESQLASLNSQRVRVRVDVDNSGAIGKAGRDAAQLASKAMSAGAAVAAIGAAVPAVGALGVALAAAAGAAALLPALLGAAGAGAGALLVGFSGVGDAITAMGAQDTASAGASSAAGSQREAALKAVESAQRSLGDAQAQAARQAVQGAQQIADAQSAVADAIQRADQVAADGARQVAAARQAVADAYENAARRVESAEASLERAQVSARDAQMALNRAREDAKENIEDLSLALSGAALDEEAAQLRLEKAQNRLAEAASKGSSSLEYREAALGVRQAEQALAETKERYGDVQQESAKANAVGVEGADNVVAAQRRVDDANSQVVSSQKALDQARVDGAKQVQQAQQRLADAEMQAAQANADAQRDVAKAKQNLARTEQQVAWAREDAQKRVADAERALADAIENVGKAGAASAGGVDKYAEALAKLSPEAREFVKALEALKPRWDALKNAVQDALFDGLAEEVTALAGIYLPMLQSMLVKVAGGFNTAFKGLSQWLQQGPQVEMMRGTFDRIGTAASLFAQALEPIGKIFFQLMAIGSEFLVPMAQGFLDSANAAAAFVTSAEGSQKIREWIQQGLTVLGQLWDILVNVGRVIGAVFGAGSESGHTFLATLVSLTDQLASFLEAPATQTALAALFQFLADNGPALLAVAVSFWAISKAIAGVAGGIKLVNTVGDIAKTFGLMGGGADTAAAKLLRFTGQGLLAIGKFAGGLALRAIGMAASWLIAMGPIGWIIAAVVGLAALIFIYWDQISAFTVAAWAVISAAISAAWTWITGIVSGAAAAVVAWISNAWNTAVAWTQSAWSNLVSAVANGIAAAVAWVAGLPGQIGSWITNTWNSAVAMTSAGWDWLVNAVAAGIAAAVAWVAGLPGQIGAWISNTWNGAVSATQAGWSWLVNAVSSGAAAAINWVAGLPGRILSALGNLGTLLWSAGQDLIMGLWNGIVGMGRWLWDNIMNWVRTYVPGPVLQFLGIASPSKLFRDEIGKFIPEGLAAGIDRNAKVAATAARSMAAGAVEGARDLVSASDFAEIEAYANQQVTAIRSGVADRLAAAGVRVPGAEGRQGATVNIFNPQAERGSDSLNRQARTLNVLGVI